MQKEMPVFLICVLALCAEALGFWQILILWQGEKCFNETFGVAIIVLLVLSAFCLLWFSYALLRKIIDRLIN